MRRSIGQFDPESGCNHPVRLAAIVYNEAMKTDQWISLETTPPLSLHIREWPAGGPSSHPPFVLLHGLASNAFTWDAVAAHLSAAGERVIAVDQRGHGLSDKPEDGYDFDTIVDDLRMLLDALAIERATVIGRSWGGNVVLAFGAAHPERVHGLGFVDGGYIDLQMRPDNTWKTVERNLKPPALAGMPAADLAERMRNGHPDWTQSGIEATMANFEILPDGTVRPWLKLDNHMLILRALWEQRPSLLYPRIGLPVYIAVAESNGDLEWAAVKRAQVAAAEAALSRVRVELFPETDHDIHVHRPAQLATAFLRELETGIWSG